MTSREVSAEELREDLEEVKVGIRQINEKFDQLGQVYLRKDVSDERYARRDAEFTALRESFAKLEAKLVWVSRAAMTGVLFPVIVALILYVITKGGA